MTGKTVCLINNDSTSNSAKNKKARELGIAVLTEEEFIEQYLEKYRPDEFIQKKRRTAAGK